MHCIRMYRSGWRFLCLVAFLAVGPGSVTTAAPNKSLKPSAVKEVDSLACQPGVVSDEISAANEWTYYVYLPKAFVPTRKWPVLFLMAPGGGKAEGLKRYIEGAEFNGWILALSVQSRNGFDKSKEAVLAMVRDVTKRLPVDQSRLYASGFSGGARMAFWLAKEDKRLAGVLACGAGGEVGGLQSKVVVYGLCGSNCFNRWDMACAFKASKNKSSRLRFFVGDHAWAQADLITHAMTCMNSCYLARPASPTPSLVEEKKALSAKIAEQIEKNAETDHEQAYEWALCLSLLDASLQSQTRQQELLKQPKVKLYADGLKEMDRFVVKHFATSPMDYKNNNGTKAAQRDATALAEKYKDTGLAPVFTRMGEPSVMP